MSKKSCKFHSESLIIKQTLQLLPKPPLRQEIIFKRQSHRHRAEHNSHQYYLLRNAIWRCCSFPLTQSMAPKNVIHLHFEPSYCFAQVFRKLLHRLYRRYGQLDDLVILAGHCGNTLHVAGDLLTRITLRIERHRDVF